MHSSPSSLPGSTEGWAWAATWSSEPPRDPYWIQMSLVPETRKPPTSPLITPCRASQAWGVSPLWRLITSALFQLWKFHCEPIFCSTLTKGKATNFECMKMVGGWFYSSSHELSWAQLSNPHFLVNNDTYLQDSSLAWEELFFVWS